ncbi:hypothetical protein [uncultured Oscillibacter sp.]|uniref:hypothetical protein n=1 Tax=uncultured Oscillibacter sp. TaxID=876091 RepID=UPI00262BB4BF|nr:hypothetical protein [uncultured Oscillibacter sp.]
MSDMNTSGWPFSEDTSGEGLNIDAIFGGGSPGSDAKPFEALPAQQAGPSAPSAPPVPAQAAENTPAQAAQTAPAAPAPTPAPAAPAAPQPAPPAETSNPIEAAFAQKTVENTQKSLLELPPVFVHKNAREPIEDTSQTFEELRIRKSEDFADLEEGKYVSWSVEYCGIRKEIKDPKGTTIISVKETMERSREFLDALKKGKGGKKPECLVKPKVVMKTKGTASAYKGNFQTVEEARASDKVICVIPSSDGRFYELQKTEMGEFIAPKNNVTEFSSIRAGFTPALPLIPLDLIGAIASFFRSFMEENAEYEALALIYWSTEERRFFAYVPKQTVRKEHLEADLRDCPYDDDPQYIRYADIHSHNSMEACFSGVDDQDERGTGLYLVMGELDRFFPDIRARISCGGSFVDIDPGEVIEGLNRDYPRDWVKNVTREQKKPLCGFPVRPSSFLPFALEERL